jgi:hypothetical protein
MANQMAKFNANLAEASAPLRGLLSSKNTWLWTETHTAAFNAVKEVILSPETLRLYDVNKPTKLRVDGSKLNGISVILYQKHGENWHPVTCGSRYLKDAEKNYYPIENEMLAVTWGCQRMSLYLQGLPHFLIETDHKPLIPILNSKQLIDMSPRIQSMRMKQLKYTFTAQHVKGVNMEDADALSRCPHEQPTEEDTIEEEVACQVNEIIENMPVSTRYLEKIKQETKVDPELIRLMKTMEESWPNSRQECPKEVQPFWDSRHDLTVIDGIIIKGNRIIIPRTLRREVLQMLHNAHQGMDRSKRRARQTCYWPSMNNDIELMVNKCSECNKHKPSKQKEPLKPHPLPTRPWEKIGSDLFEHEGKHYIVVTDYYSLWPELYQLNVAKTPQVIEVMKEAFSRHGIPTELVSDNGSQYKSYLFKQFAKSWDFEHTTSSPRYPRSNGLAESSVKTMKAMVKKCLASNRDIKQALLTIRNTPLSCGKSPAELLLGRQLNDNMPRLPAQMNSKEPEKRDMMAERYKQKTYHDQKVSADLTNFQPGQRVAIQDHVTKEWSIKGRIVKEVAPRSYSIQVSDGGNVLRRNRSQIRKLHSTTSSTHTTHDEERSYDYTSDSDTIPYDEEEHWSESEEEQWAQSEEELWNWSESEEEEPVRSSRGRVIRSRRPVDYEDY